MVVIMLFIVVVIMLVSVYLQNVAVGFCRLQQKRYRVLGVRWYRKF